MTVARAGGAALGRNILFYGLTAAVQRAASFILLPVYTRYLSPADYGVLQLLQISLDVVSIALTAGTTAGVMRFYFKTDDERERRAIFATALGLLLAFNALAAIALFGAEGWIARAVIGRPEEAPLVRLLALGFLLEPAVAVPLLLMQARERARLFSFTSICRLALQIGLNLGFVVALGWAVRGVLLSTALTNALVGGLATLWLLRQTGLRTSRTAARALLAFGLPYRATQAGAFVLTFADRYFLKVSRGLDEVGVYGLAYQFGFLLIMASSMPYMQAWAPQRFAAARLPAAERDAALDPGFRHYCLAVVTVGLGIALLARPALAVMSGPGFQAAAGLVPIIVVAYVLQALTDAVELGIQLSERTRYATYATGLAVVVVVILYAVWIPRLGGLGAALATLVAFLVRFVACYAWSQRLCPIHYRWGPVLRLAGFALAAFAIGSLGRGLGLTGQVACAAAAFGGYAMLVWWGGVLADEERRATRDWVRSRALAGTVADRP